MRSNKRRRSCFAFIFEINRQKNDSLNSRNRIRFCEICIKPLKVKCDKFSSIRSTFKVIKLRIYNFYIVPKSLYINTYIKCKGYV